jgi:hypothetical protein
MDFKPRNGVVRRLPPDPGSREERQIRADAAHGARPPCLLQDFGRRHAGESAIQTLPMGPPSTQSRFVHGLTIPEKLLKSLHTQDEEHCRDWAARGWVNSRRRFSDHDFLCCDRVCGGAGG